MSESSFVLGDALLCLVNDSSQAISKRHEIAKLDQSQKRTQLLQLATRVGEANDDITDEKEVFSKFGSFIIDASSLTRTDMQLLLGTLASSYQGAVGSLHEDLQIMNNNGGAVGEVDVAKHSEVIGRYSFLLKWAVDTAERVDSYASDSAERPLAAARSRKGNSRSTTTASQSSAAASRKAPVGKIDWSEAGITMLEAMSTCLKLKLARIMPSSSDRSSLVNLYTQIANKVLESEIHIKKPAFVFAASDLLCVATKFHGFASNVATLLMQLLQHYTHCSSIIADIVSTSCITYDTQHLVDEMLRNIGDKSISDSDKISPKSIGEFVVKLSEKCQRPVLRHFSLICNHLGCSAYQLRCSIVEVVVNLIIYLNSDAASESTMINSGHNNSQDASDDDEDDDDSNVNMDAVKKANKRSLTPLYDLFLQRFRDSHWVCRSSQLKLVASKVCSNPTAFNVIREDIVEVVISRLSDKTSLVRRSAIKALNTLIATHPFNHDGGLLNKTRVQDQLDKACRGVAAILAESGFDELNAKKKKKEKSKSNNNNEDMDIDNEDNNNNSNGNEEEEVSIPEAAEAVLNSLSPELAERLAKLQAAIQYYKDYMRFILQVESAVPTLRELLSSVNRTDAVEAMDFFERAVGYELEEADVGIRAMLHLIWVADTSMSSNTQPTSTAQGDDGSGGAQSISASGVRGKLIEHFTALFIPPRQVDQSEKQHGLFVVRKLIELTYGLKLAELVSLEEIIASVARHGMIPSYVLDLLWRTFGYKKSDMAPAQRRGALIILSMVGKSRPEILRQNLDTLLRFGLVASDLVLARYTCISLQRLAGQNENGLRTTVTADHTQTNSDGDNNDNSYRFPLDSPVLQQIQQIVLTESTSPDWFPAAEQALNAIFALCVKPDSMAASIVHSKARTVFGSAGNGELPTGSADPAKLAQLFFLVGHVATKELAYLEVAETEIKRRAELASKSGSGNAGGRFLMTPRTLPRSAARGGAGPGTAGGGGGGGQGGQDDEFQNILGNAQDDIGQAMSYIRERQLIVTGHGLLGSYAPLIVHVTAHHKQFKHKLLRTHACLALSKLMCISTEFCISNLPLLFKILSSDPNPVIRCNAAIGIGDLARLFSTIVGENMKYLYDALTDRDVDVRRNVLMVLAQLALNDAIKVKGNLGNIACCLVDSDKRISDFTKHFFRELASKGSTVYNNVSDIISTLSNRTPALPESDYISIMRMVLDFVGTKETNIVNLTAQLCHRFGKTDEKNVRMLRDTAAVLAMLPFRTVAAVKKLADAMPEYRYKLHDKIVYEYFVDIVAKTRARQVKEDVVQLLDEYAGRLKEARASCLGATAEEIEAEENRERQVADGEDQADEDIEMADGENDAAAATTQATATQGTVSQTQNGMDIDDDIEDMSGVEDDDGDEDDE
ncbi:ARM repeat-containing protein [Ramicandelaber brevisporus]|nr:ARM repeat-containing protein [Ramicandelaber brevisporus]